MVAHREIGLRAVHDPQRHLAAYVIDVRVSSVRCSRRRTRCCGDPQGTPDHHGRRP